MQNAEAHGLANALNAGVCAINLAIEELSFTMHYALLHQSS